MGGDFPGLCSGLQSGFRPYEKTFVLCGYVLL
jgi:hypothetical protein